MYVLTVFEIDKNISDTQSYKITTVKSKLESNNILLVAVPGRT